MEKYKSEYADKINNYHSEYKFKDINIDELDLSIRTNNILKKNGINSLLIIIKLTVSDLIRIKNLEKKH